MTKRPPNYTTSITVSKTVSECLELLGEAGADSISTIMKDRKPVGLAFQIQSPGGDYMTFRMPVNVEGVAELFRRIDEEHGWPAGLYHARAKAELARIRSKDQPARVAWRQIRDWLVAQLGIIDANMVSIDQVMLPYLQVGPGKSLYDQVRDNWLALPAGNG